MKKIFAILSVVAMMFVACTPNKGGDEEIVPTFPALQELTVESGKSYDITFTTDKAWTVSLSAESAVYATLTYTGADGFTSTDTQFYGEAGEHTITVNVREGIMSYAKDIAFNVDMTIDQYTQSIAKLTIPITPYEIDVYGTAPDGFENVLTRFITGGHPADGPFVNVPNKYSVRYLNASEAKYGDYVVAHDFDKLYNYVVYAKDAEGNFVAVGEESKWLAIRTFKRTINGKSYSMFSLEMNHNSNAAVFTEGVGYEAYVNIEDENGDAIVSVYFLYDPNAVVVVETKVELANPALATEKGVTFEGSAVTYTLTLPTSDILTTNYEAAALKFSGYNEVYGGFGSGTQNLVFEHNEASDIWYVRLADGASAASLVREEVLNISAVGNEMHSYTINLIFDWIADNGGSGADGTVSFVNAEVANAEGATLVKLNSTDADYNSEWGIETQYRLTYTSEALLTTPAKAALNIPGFELGMIVNTDDMGADHFNYSEALEFYKDTTTGEVLLGYRPQAEEATKAEVKAPNGSCELFCCDAEGVKFARILFVLDAK